MAASATPYALDRYVLDTLMRDLVGHDRRTSAFLVYLRLTAAEADGHAALSYAQLAESTGLSRRAVQDAVNHLLRRALIAVRRGHVTEVATYRPLRPWRKVPRA